MIIDGEHNVVQNAHGTNIAQATSSGVGVVGDYYAGDEAYRVTDLANPYLGLQAFTYAKRDIYAGRDQEVADAVRLITQPGAARTLLFVNGASGSGKSSFAQAGLLPALETHYNQQHNTTARAVFRPGEKPLAGLAVALHTLHIPCTGIFAAAAEHQSAPPQTPADPTQISLLVIDQFEEIFTQSDVQQRNRLFDLLAALPPFEECRMHVITTMRADYLPDLFYYQALFDIAKTGIDLRAMSKAALKAAIQRPFQVIHPNSGKGFQPALLDRLAEDASEDATYLPLLQVTLEDLWNNGYLTLDHYESLGDAIRRRAEEIFRIKRTPEGTTTLRTAEEQEQMLQVFLDLVEPSQDDDPRHDIRRTRNLEYVIRGRSAMRTLVHELATARLLATDIRIAGDGAEEIESLDIIHESLIANWSCLRDAIRMRREDLRRRSRFEQRLGEWLEHQEGEDFLLLGIHLAEAEDLQKHNDVAVQLYKRLKTGTSRFRSLGLPGQSTIVIDTVSRCDEAG